MKEFVFTEIFFNLNFYGIAIMSMYRRVASSLFLLFRRAFFPVFATCFLYSSSEILLGDSALKTDQLYPSKNPKLEEKIPQDQVDHDSHKTETVSMMLYYVETTEGLMDWVQTASEDKRCLLILLSSNSAVFQKISQKGKKKLQEACYLLQAEKESVSVAYSIPLEQEENAIAVLACPMEDDENHLIMIHWVIMTEKDQEVIEMINSDKNLVEFFKELNEGIVPEMQKEEEAIQKVELLVTHAQEA